MIDLSLPIEQLKSVGARNLPRLAKLGIKTVKDLLWHFPARYEDYSKVVPISEIEPGQKVNVQGEILKMSTRMIFPKRMSSGIFPNFFSFSKSIFQIKNIAVANYQSL